MSNNIKLLSFELFAKQNKIGICITAICIEKMRANCQKPSNVIIEIYYGGVLVKIISNQNVGVSHRKKIKRKFCKNILFLL